MERQKEENEEIKKRTSRCLVHDLVSPEAPDARLFLMIRRVRTTCQYSIYSILFVIILSVNSLRMLYTGEEF